MAENEEEVDLDAKKPSGSKKNIIIYALLGVLLVGLSVTTTLLFLGGGNGGGEESTTQAEAEEEPEKKGEAIYHPLDTMVVNFTKKGPARFLQVDIQVMTRDGAVVDAIEAHTPIIRNDILLLLSNQTYEKVSTLEGKEQLRQEVLETIQRILKEQGEPDSVEAVYFTSFVMQ